MPQEPFLRIQQLPVFFIALFTCLDLQAQKNTDTAYRQLPDIQVKAFEQNRKLQDVPAAINLVSRSILDRYGTGSVVQAINSLPGIHMEERSPGSYRLNIRGSSLRSPFGVRNVKTYFNDIPLTDPGGHTYLNQLGYYNFNSIEIIKGPGSSLYGTGTGGVMLIESLSGNEKPGIYNEFSAGSFGYMNLYASGLFRNNDGISKIGIQHQKSNGYRQHSALQRDVLSWTAAFPIRGKNDLKTSFLYGDLFYETPGALTQNEYNTDPKAARPPAGSFPGAEQARASIHQKSFLSGLSYDQQLGNNWKNKSVVYGMFTELKNPTLRNYGKTSEPHFGGRTVFNSTHQLKDLLVKLSMGGEWQEGFSMASIYKNVSGSPDSLQTEDEIHNRQSFVFTQLSLDWKNWVLVGGLSWNQMHVRFQRFAPATTGIQNRNFDNQLAPRLAVLKKVGRINIYSSVSKGFSPPTTSELLPTGSSINLDLNAEQGINYDLGAKGILGRNVYFDINAFHFLLDHTIVQRRDAGGGDYFVNAGKTSQTGIETYAGIPLFDRNISIDRALLWVSHTWHHFQYSHFTQLNNDYSGNDLPGTARHSVAAGFDLQIKNGFTGALFYNFSGRIPLNDANTVYAGGYHLLGIKMGYQKLIEEKWLVKIQAGGDNLFNQVYSLGNDINGFGGRYFNAAPSRNYFAGVVFQWIAKNQKS